MTDLARRFPGNPIVGPADVPPSRPGLSVLGVLNPGVFRFQGRTWLLLRVAEGIPAGGGLVSAPVLDRASPGGTRLVQVRDDDVDLVNVDSRGFVWRGDMYLSSISHLRLASSEDGVRFEVSPRPALEGEGDLECFGVEDCRVSEIGGRFRLAYTAVSPSGAGVAMASTMDWRSYERHGMVLPPPNKDCVLFPETIGGAYVALHRPMSAGLGGQHIWIARSPDLAHWGGHQCILRPRRGSWDSVKLGAGAPPVRIPDGWLEIYHGVSADGVYRLGAALLAADDPARVLGRSRDPIMEPLAEYERTGFFGNVVFATGTIVDGDQLTLYYGASDQWVCGATLSIRDILAGLE
jgi:beta-1,2-mannobiose phosphorylase / 1,2-beta-oligomannan phosphorylase